MPSTIGVASVWAYVSSVFATTKIFNASRVWGSRTAGISFHSGRSNSLVSGLPTILSCTADWKWTLPFIVERTGADVLDARPHNMSRVVGVQVSVIITAQTNLLSAPHVRMHGDACGVLAVLWSIFLESSTGAVKIQSCVAVVMH